MRSRRTVIITGRERCKMEGKEEEKKEVNKENK
jgi:hypothetical protein